MTKQIIALLLVLITINSFAQEFGKFTDSRDGKTYKTVQIGPQVWMAENLTYKIDSGCWAYDNDENNVLKYGYLYNLNTAKNVCPDDWRLPTEEDFRILLDNSGSSKEEAYKNLTVKDSCSFLALLGGWCNLNGKSENLGQFGCFWSSSNYKKDNYWHFIFFYWSI